MLCPPYPLLLHALMVGGEGSSPCPDRRLCGLAARCERTLRGVAPHWLAQQAAWGEVGDLLGLAAAPAHWLCQELLQQASASSLPASASTPLVRLLVSNTASQLKAAPALNWQKSGCWAFCLPGAPVLQEAVKALAPAITSLLLPRLASVRSFGGPFSAANAAVFIAELSDDLKGSHSLPVLGSCHMSALLRQAVVESSCFASKHINSQEALKAIDALARCATHYARTSVFVVRKGCDGLPANSPGLRAQLAQPVFMLLGSPLLDLLVLLQHVVIASWEGSDRWPSIPPAHELPAGMDPDAVDSKLTMQVRSTCR